MKDIMDNFNMAWNATAELKNRYNDCLSKTEKAVRDHPKHYLKFRKMVDDILCRSIDVSEYYPLACELAQMIQSMGEETVFYHYFFENIHPNVNGRARYFRSICRDLKNRIDEFNHWRARQRNIRLI